MNAEASQKLIDLLGKLLKRDPNQTAAGDIIQLWKLYAEKEQNILPSVIAKLTVHDFIIERFMIPPDGAIQYIAKDNVADAVDFVLHTSGWHVVFATADASVAICGRHMLKETNLGVVFDRAWPSIRETLAHEMEVDAQDPPGPNDALYKQILEEEASSSA